MHTDTHNHVLVSSGITVASLYLIKVVVIFPQVAACLLRASLIRVKGICLLLLSILKYYSIYRVIYMLMQRLPLRRPLTQAVRLCVKRKKKDRRKKEIVREN